MKDSNLEETDPKLDELERKARRRLLKMALYVPPAVIGTLLVSRKAHAQPISCPPGTGCQPNCGPSQCKPGR